MTKKLLFFWTSSFVIAVVCYYLLWLLMPGHRVFGSWYRMILYHYGSPIQYIAIPCFFYGIFASAFATRFKNKSMKGQIGLTIFIIVITIVASSPFGGMLWYFHDMQAGYFPNHWISKLVLEGSIDGLTIGWFIVLFSFPYNMLGTVVCFFLTRKGIENFT